MAEPLGPYRPNPSFSERLRSPRCVLGWHKRCDYPPCKCKCHASEWEAECREFGCHGQESDGA